MIIQISKNVSMSFKNNVIYRGNLREEKEKKFLYQKTHCKMNKYVAFWIFLWYIYVRKQLIEY